MARNLPETVHEYNIGKLNWWFIFSSILLLLCVGWMLYDDYMREWKPYQRESKKLEAQRLQQDRTDAEKRMSEAGFADVKAKYDAALKTLEEQKKVMAPIEERLAKVNAELQVMLVKSATAKALLDQRKSEYDGAIELQKSPKAVAAALNTLHKQEALLGQLNRNVQDIQAKREPIQEELNVFTSEKKKLEREVGTLSAKRNLIEKRHTELTSKILPLVLDKPLIEFAVPTIRVKQIIADDQTYSLNFVDVSRIDRCTTCHTFADKKDGAESDEGLKFASLPQPWRSHPRLDLFLSPESPHPIEKFGCSVCHAGWDRATTFINAAHTPSYYPTKQDYVKLPFVEGKPYWVPKAAMEKWKPGMLAKVEEHSRLVEEKRLLKASHTKDPEKLQQTITAIQAAREELKNTYGMDTASLSKFEFASMTQEEAWVKPPQAWHEMHHKEDPMRPKEFIESSCLKCHQGATEVPVLRLPGADTNPGEKINMGLRLIEQAGCYACHKMSALETVVTHKVRTTGNKIKRIDTLPDGRKVEKEISEPKESLTEIAHAKGSDVNAIMAANGLSDPQKIEGGMALQIPVRVPHPKPGPSLKKIAAKTTEAWMVKWLENPKAFRPNTFMPQFWNLDNCRYGTTFDGSMPDKPMKIDWADRSAVEMKAIAQWIFKQSDPLKYPAPPAGDAIKGEKLVNSVGCMGCHVVDQKLTEVALKDRRPRSQGPQLFGSGSKYDAGWLYNWLKDPSQYSHDTRMPNLRLSNQEAADITAFLMNSKNAEFDARTAPEIKPEVLEDTLVDYLKTSSSIKKALEAARGMEESKKLDVLGEKLVQRYGCMNCHSIEGMEKAKPISIELSDWASKNPHKLDFGFIEIPHNNYAYLHQKLQAPRSFDHIATKRPQEILRMPQYNFTDEQIELIMTAVMGMTAEKPTANARRNLNEDEWYVENGRFLIKELNCVGCHINEDEGGAIRRTMDEDKSFLFPPNLAGVGAKTRTNWLHDFIKNPGEHKYRYWLEARMPTYNLSDDQLNTLTHYFALRDQQAYPFETEVVEDAPSKEILEAGENIVKELKCMSCHAPRTPEQAAADGSTAVNLSGIKGRMRSTGLMAWLKAPGTVTPGVNMPAFWPHGQPSPLPNILGGDSQKQMEAVAAYLKVYNSQASSSAKTAVK